MRNILLLTALLAGFSQAAEYDAHTPDGMGADGGGFKDIFSRINAPAPIPQEQEFQFPTIATLQAWAPIQFYQEMKSNSYKIALDSLSLGKDQVVRYVVAVSPKSGGNQNIIFEGIDCKTNQYRTYGWGNSKQEWTKNSKVTWKLIQKNQHNAWQASLADSFCRVGEPWPIETIRKDFKADKQSGDCPACRNK
nr:CNP1-like family protein [uncultured Deefgea sp.]